MADTLPATDGDLLDFVPTLRADFLRREVDGECIVWSPLASGPTVLDPVAHTMLEVFDGEAPVAVIAREVHEEVGVPLDVAQQQLARIIRLFDGAGLLKTSVASAPTPPNELFVSPCTSCMQNSVRGMTLLSVQLGDTTVGVACDSSRATKKLRAALDAGVVQADEDAPVGFVLTAPAGFTRSHSLRDRSGFVHSSGRGLDAGLRAMASHLTAFLPLAPGSVRVRARTVVVRSKTVVCLFPLLYMPSLESKDLSDGLELVDRLAIDIDVATGRLCNPEIPWPELGDLKGSPGHLSPAAAPPHVAAVVVPRPAQSVPLTQAGAISALAHDALGGSPSDVLDGLTQLVGGARLITVQPQLDRLTAALENL